MRVDFLSGESGGDLVARCAAASGGRLVRLSGDAAEGAGPDDLLGDWQELLDAQRGGTRYNSPRRFAAGAAAARPDGRQPLAALFSADGRARAVIVGALRPGDAWHGAGPLARLLPGLNCLTIPQTGIVTDGSAEAVAAVVGCLDTLLRGHVLQRVEIDNLATGGALHRALEQGPGAAFGLVRRDHVRFCRRLRDPQTGEPVQVNSGKTRQGLRRKQRNLRDQFGGDLEFVQVTSPDRTDWFAQNAARIVAQTYQAALGIGVRDDPAMRSYLHDLATEGVLRGYLFLGQGAPVAYVLGDLENGVFNLWATSFLPDYAQFSPGVVLLNQVFEELTAEGAELFDFGHGDADYKRRLGDVELRQESLRIYGPGAVPHTAFLVHVGSDGLRDRMRGALVRSGRLDQARKFWRTCLRRAGRI